MKTLKWAAMVLWTLVLGAAIWMMLAGWVYGQGIGGGGVIVGPSPGSIAAGTITGIVGTNQGGTGVNVGALAGTNISGFIQLTPASGSQGSLIDMQVGVAPYANAFGLTEAGPEGVGRSVTLWFSGSAGTGSNVWGRDILNIQNALGVVGNQYWMTGTTNDFPIQSSAPSFHQMYSSNMSTIKAAVGFSGNTNTLSGVVQPIAGMVCGNPWTGAPGWSVRAAFTNSALGMPLVGTNADGIAVYISQFGFSINQIGDAYANIITNNPSGNFIIASDPQLSEGWVINGARSGDSTPGQVPEMWIDHTNNYQSHIWAGFPRQVANVWAPHQVSPTGQRWQWALMADEITGNAYVGTNGTTTMSNIITGNGGKIIINQQPGDDESTGVNINTNVSFNNTTGGNGSAAWTFDGVGNHSVGFWSLSGQFTKLAHGKTTPLYFTRNTTGNDLIANDGGAFTDAMLLDTSDNVIIFNNLNVQGAFTIGSATNTPSFTVVNTNWISGATYTNQTGRTIAPWAPCSINPASVAGLAGFSLTVPGVTTNSYSQVTLIGTLAMPSTNRVGPCYVTNGGTFIFTNISSGAGDSAAIVNGGQYIVF